MLQQYKVGHTHPSGMLTFASRSTPNPGTSSPLLSTTSPPRTQTDKEREEKYKTPEDFSDSIERELETLRLAVVPCTTTASLQTSRFCHHSPAVMPARGSDGVSTLFLFPLFFGLNLRPPPPWMLPAAWRDDRSHHPGLEGGRARRICNDPSAPPLSSLKDKQPPSSKSVHAERRAANTPLLCPPGH